MFGRARLYPIGNKAPGIRLIERPVADLMHRSDQVIKGQTPGDGDNSRSLPGAKSNSIPFLTFREGNRCATLATSSKSIPSNNRHDQTVQFRRLIWTSAASNHCSSNSSGSDLLFRPRGEYGNQPTRYSPAFLFWITLSPETISLKRIFQYFYHKIKLFLAAVNSCRAGH